MKAAAKHFKKQLDGVKQLRMWAKDAKIGLKTCETHKGEAVFAATGPWKHMHATVDPKGRIFVYHGGCGKTPADTEQQFKEAADAHRRYLECKLNLKDIDESIRPHIQALWRMGWHTIYSCSGIPSDHAGIAGKEQTYYPTSLPYVSAIAKTHSKKLIQDPYSLSELIHEAAEYGISGSADASILKHPTKGRLPVISVYLSLREKPKKQDVGKRILEQWDRLVEIIDANKGLEKTAKACIIPRTWKKTKPPWRKKKAKK